MAQRRGGWLLVANVCLAGCLAAPSSATDGNDDGPGADDSGPGEGDGGAGGIDAGPPPQCGDGTALTIAHVSGLQLESGRDPIPLEGLAVFSNTGTTTIHTQHIQIAEVVTIGSADFDLAISDAVDELPPGESHGFLDETSRPLMMELVQGFWSDQSRPHVLGSITHSITSGTFEATITYRLGELQVDVEISFSVNGGSGAINGMIFDSYCAGE